MTTRHTAEITDPLTGGITTLTAPTAAELDQLVDAHLEQHYPTPPEEDPEPAGMGCPTEADKHKWGGPVVGGGR